ncbi:MAG: TIM barrel protein [Planctomycetia bacterium]|nr:TIM barrel protein [Planctomycetia bacterium]
MKRRDFLKTTALTAVAGTLPGALAHAEETVWKTKLKKAMITKYPTEDTLTLWKRNGFTGCESTDWSCGPEKAAEARKVADRLGMEIHSVMRAWTNVNGPSFDSDVESMECALQTAQGYGANAVLWVPCRTGGTLPKPTDFQIDFDPETLRVTRVVAGDNTPYKDYIDAQNLATQTTLAAVKKLIPMAEKTGVVIGLENVWNNLWVLPDFFAALVKSFKSPWVQGYFDIGNHVRYAAPEKYIYALGSDIIKLHVKDFAFAPDEPNCGKFCGLRQGSVNWPVVRKAIEDVGYNGYMTLECGGEIGDLSRLLDDIIAGK